MSSFTLIILFLLVNIVVVAAFDLKTRIISNYWSVSNLVFCLVFFFLFPDYFDRSFQHFQIPLAFFVVTFILFAMKIMGGGDSKYFSTLFLIIPTLIQMAFLHKLIILTAVVGFIFLLINIVKRRNLVKMELLTGQFKSLYFKLGSKVPYAPIAALAWIWQVVESLYLES